MHDPVHFVLGDSAGGALRQQLGDVPIVVTRDLFTEGPCRFTAADGRVLDGGDRAWLERRCDWWAQVAGEQPDAVAAGREAVRSLSEALDDLGDTPIVVWCADGTSEQLHLCWLVALLEANDADHDEVIVARPTSAGSGFLGVGSSPPSILANAARIPLSGADRALAGALWRAFAAPTPAQLDAALGPLGSHPLFENLPFLRQRFPGVSDGLGVWERRSLERIAAHDGEPAARTVGHLLQMDVPDFVGDLVLFHRMLDLCRDGLLAASGDGRTIRTTAFRITDLGRSVIAGQQHRAAVSGFDRWIGGTHVTTPDGLWSRDGDRITRLDLASWGGDPMR